jgi:hypothetical protein
MIKTPEEMETKKILFFAIILALLTAALQAQEIISDQIAEKKLIQIFVLDGTVILEVSEGVNFPCIGIRLTDRSLNMQLGTYMEIKKRGEFYLMEDWYGKKYSNINDGIEDVLNEIFMEFYDEMRQEEIGEIVWSAFIREDGLQLFIDFANEIIDDEFLNSPFNETYG